jgi:hypothetical protein
MILSYGNFSFLFVLCREHIPNISALNLFVKMRKSMPYGQARRKFQLVFLTKQAGICMLLPAAFALLSSPLYGQGSTFQDSLNQWLAARHIRLTTVTRDKGIVALGTQFVLQQDGLVLTNIQRNYAPSNTYKDGAIKPDLALMVDRRVASGEAKIFNTGDKLWVTGIAIKDNAVDLRIISDQYGGSRFYGNLKFPTPKGVQPDAQLVEAMITRTFSNGPGAEIAQSATPIQAQTTSATPAKPTASAQSAAARVVRSGPAPTGGVFAGVTFHTIKSPEVAASLHHDVPTLVLDLNLLQNNLALLDDPEVMKYFVLLNNCVVTSDASPNYDPSQQKVLRVLGNELDYPAVAAYYKNHAAEILTDLPTAVGLSNGSSTLGKYDTTRHAFPFNPVVVARFAAMRADVEVEAGYPCGLVGYTRSSAARSGKLPTVYIMDIGQEHTFNEVPLDLDAAHKYLDTGRSDRQVSVYVDLLISDAPAPHLEKCPPSLDAGFCGMYTAQLKKVTVMASPTTRPARGPIGPGTPLAVLYP